MVGLFSSHRSKPAPVTQATTLGSGRLLVSDQPIDASVATLDAVLEQTSPSPYVHMPRLTTPGYTWLTGDQPDLVLAFSDADNDFYVASFQRNGAGTRIGLFPQGSGDARLNLVPVIGPWKMRDASLSSHGVVAAGAISLRAPQLPPTYLGDMLEAAGCAVTPPNVSRLGTEISMLFLIKAQQFMNRVDAHAAQAFLLSHGWDGQLASLQRILDDLGSWDVEVLPFIQDLPWRIQGLLLEPGRRGQLWDELAR